MVRSKTSTLQKTPKSKSKVHNHLKNARQCKCGEMRKALADIAPVNGVSTRSASCSTESCSMSDEDRLLGLQTRTQFKMQAYEKIREEKADVTGTGGCESRRAIVDFSCVDKFVNKLTCPSCQKQTLRFMTDVNKLYGLAVHGHVFCSTCQQVVEGTDGFLAERGELWMKDFTINRQAVFSALVCGMGAVSFNNFSEMMDLQGIHHKTFDKKAQQLYDKLEDFADGLFSRTAKYVRQVHANQSGISTGEDAVLDISVSFDGTWLTRGFSSHIGVGCVVDLLTGLCLDAHVMSNYCQQCETTGRKLLADKPMEYAGWLVQHLSKCDKTFQGSSGMMEVEAARVMWPRSVGRHKLRYTVMLSDGDSKTFDELNRIKPYGDTRIDKEECVNHVSKRLGTALRNVVADCRKKGVTLGGRGRGQLTQNAIRKLTIYYNRAIRSNRTSPEAIKKAILASLQHCYSTDSKPLHELCPAGKSSWCFFQAAVAEHQIPGPHKELIHTPLNYEKLHKYLAPIYERLTSIQLLSRCVAGKTQNSNECLHSLIWGRCAKNKFASRRRVSFAVLTAIQEFNFGPAASQDTASFFGFKKGTHMKRLGASRQKRRETNSIKNKKDKENKRRDAVRKAKLKRQEELLKLEGGPVYGAGLF